MWFRSQPTCPVAADEKEWIENRMAWLVRELGSERLLKHKTILPTTEFFPASYQRTEDDLRDILARVSRFMDLDAEKIQLNLYQDDHPKFQGEWNKGTAGLYFEADGKFNVWLEVSILDDPNAVVATLAHELGHVILLGQKRLLPEEPDHEPLTDLLTVYLGLGILTANAVIHESYWHSGYMSGWKMGRSGYLSMDMFGYALALYARARAENPPTWLNHLRPDVRSACRQGLRYLERGGECGFHFGG